MAFEPTSPRALLPLSVVYGAVGIGGAAYCAWTAPTFAWLGAAPVGFVLWPLGYYATHRWLLHAPHPPRWLASFEDHRHHHREPSDPSELQFSVLETAPLFVLVHALVFAATRDLAFTAGALSGFCAGYLCYEWLHWAVHTPATSRHRLVQRLGANHLYHHNHPRQCFGTVVPLWDWVFGTYGRPARR